MRWQCNSQRMATKSDHSKSVKSILFWQSGSCRVFLVSETFISIKTSNRIIHSQWHRIKPQKREAFGRRRRRTVERELRHTIGIAISNAAESAEPGLPPGVSGVFGWKFSRQHSSESALELQPLIPQSTRREHKCQATFDPAGDAGNDFWPTTFSNHGITAKGIPVDSRPI